MSMFDDLLDMNAVEIRDHLVELEAERALAITRGLSKVETYMADLDEEIAATRQLYVASAVTEIATLRAELSGALLG